MQLSFEGTAAMIELLLDWTRVSGHGSELGLTADERCQVSYFALPFSSRVGRGTLIASWASAIRQGWSEVMVNN